MKEPAVLTMDAYFLRAARRYPTRSFMRPVRPEGSAGTPYAQGAVRLASLVDQLSALGLRCGDRVVCYLDEPAPAIELMLACAFVGVVIVPLSPNYSIDALEKLRARVDARWVLTTVDHAGRLVAAGMKTLCWADGASPPPGAVPVAPTSAASVEAAWTTLERASAGHGEDDLYLMIPTSGTTGESKLIMRSHRAFAGLAGPMQLGLDFDVRPQERMLMAAAMTHGIGQAALALGLSIAAELGIPSRIEGATLLEEVHLFDPTYLYVNPRVVNTLIEQHRRAYASPGEHPPVLGRSTRILRLGGAPSNVASIRQAVGPNVDVGEIYSSSETGSVAITPLGGGGLRVMPDVQVRIAEDGEILVSTRRGMSGYYGAPELSKACFSEDGFYKTGDLGELGEGGRLTFLGRKRDVFNTASGDNLNPARIEGMLEVLPWVRQVVLIGDQRPFICALITLRQELPQTEGDGYINQRSRPELYREVGREIEKLNANLEGAEQIKRFALFSRELPPELYAKVGGDKTRRNRKAIEAAYAERIAALYS